MPSAATEEWSVACVSSVPVVSHHSIESRSYRAVGRPDRLLQAAVTSFCSIPRPTRRETAQLDDLSGPLLNLVSDDTLRFVAASLSDTPHAPPVLIRKLADLPPGISAPLLLRSPVLGSIDLLALIGRHGTGHARVIAARHDLDSRIARLIETLGIERAAPADETPQSPDHAASPADRTRDRLRTMMRPSGTIRKHGSNERVLLRWDGDPGSYRKLRSTALTGVPDLVRTALADALDVDKAHARSILETTDMSRLIVAMRALRLSEEQAFLIVQCVWPTRLASLRSIAAFFDAYAAITAEQADRMVDQWRMQPEREAANEPHGRSNLRAS